MSAEKHHYPEVNPNPNFATIEREVLDFWKNDGTFEKSVEKNTSDEFVFYDGPPFANGLPHYGHLLTGFVKDVFARYQTMQGKRVERRFGWDCHGLPAEMGSEKELGISGRGAIQNFGIDKFNEHCRSSVMKYTGEWRNYVSRQARWVDFDNDYKTMDTNFMESVLWAFKQLYEKGLIYEAHRVMPYSWAAETPLSNFETKLDNSYREREDKAITVAFELNEKPAGAPDAEKYYILAWTTTPWTLPSNLALAVGKEVEYIAIKVASENCCYIVSSDAEQKLGLLTRGTDLKPGEKAWIKPDGQMHSITNSCQEYRGKDLIGLSYKPLFPYFEKHPNAFRILDGSSFVTDGDGTGIVHMAPGFGEEDQKCCEANDIEVVVPVDGQGKYTDAIFDLPNLHLTGLNVIAQTEGQNADEPYKPEQVQKFGLANLRIVNYLKNKYPDGTNRVIKEEQIKHNYPHCWRTDTPLIYRAMPSWYVEVTKFRDRAAELNQHINWIPTHIRDGQMDHMLKTAPDWSISRNRFWGTPIPVWRSKSGKIKVFGSIAELEAASGQKIIDIHRPYIDNIIITDNGEEYTRVEDVFDCWFESGSMPFAQVHYPFENKDWFEKHFPADFITEYVGQTRGWFNTLIMLSTALFDKIPFKNCICHGVVLDAETGLKYSKRLKNYKDPFEVIDQFGADALRWLMIASPVMRGQDIMVDPEGKFIRDVVRLAIKPIWNAYNFFTLYANADGIKAKEISNSKDIMDKYILQKCSDAVHTIRVSLNDYNTPAACDATLQFFEALNNWYIRRNKERFWKSEHDEDKQSAYDTLYTVLTIICRAIAALLPLTTEEIFKNLTGKPSVHLENFPSNFIKTIEGNFIDGIELMHRMDWARDVCNSALSIRSELNIRVRQPLNSLTIVTKSDVQANEIISDEVNVKTINIVHNFNNFATLKLSINSAVLGKRLPEKMKQILPASKKGEWKQVDGGVEIAGEKLLPNEYVLQLEPKPEYKDRAQALSTNDALVILDTTITPELEAEGIARDAVRAIQQARKDGDFNVSDRIKLHLDAPQKLLNAIYTHQQYILEQTLSHILLTEKPTNGFSAEVEIDDQKMTITIVKE